MIKDKNTRSVMSRELRLLLLGIANDPRRADSVKVCVERIIVDLGGSACGVGEGGSNRVGRSSSSSSSNGSSSSSGDGASCSSDINDDDDVDDCEG